MSTHNTVEQAADILRKGGLVAFPTETVYGLGADASNPEAVAQIYRVKGRPSHNPLIVHVQGVEQIAHWASDIPSCAVVLAEHFWPGPLTLVLPKHPNVHPAVCADAPTVAVRVPSHPVARALLRAFQGGVAAPSANRSGHVSPTCAQHVRNDLGSDVDMVLEGGSSEVGLESTIVSVVHAQPCILRTGSITQQMLSAVLGQHVPVLTHSDVVSPGQSVSHYAPHAQVFLTQSAEEAAAYAGDSTGYIGMPHPCSTRFVYVWQPPTLEAYAHGLYHALRTADEKGCKNIVAVLPPYEEIGMAVCDRLTRAAAPRGPSQR